MLSLTDERLLLTSFLSCATGVNSETRKLSLFKSVRDNNSLVGASEALSPATLELLRGSWHIKHLSASSLPSSLMKVHVVHVQVEIGAAIVEVR